MRTARRAFALLLLATALAGTSFTIQALDLPQHRHITKYVLSQVRVPVAGKDRTFAKGAIDQVIQANEDTDDISTLSAA